MLPTLFQTTVVDRGVGLASGSSTSFHDQRRNAELSTSGKLHPVRETWNGLIIAGSRLTPRQLQGKQLHPEAPLAGCAGGIDKQRTF